MGIHRTRVIAWFSGGVTSAVACHLALQIYRDVEIVFLDTKNNEHEDTYRFLKDCELFYGQDIAIISNPKYETIQDVWRKFLSLNTANGAICSSELKREMRNQYQNLEIHYAQVFGFEFEKRQIKRHVQMRRNYPEINAQSPLIEAKMNKADCKHFLQEMGLEIPVTYEIYENNNCHKTGCVQGGIGYWQLKQRREPEVFDAMAAMEHELTDKKGKPVTCIKDQTEGQIRRLFLKPHPDYPEIKHLGMIKGRQPVPIPECFGFCMTENSVNYGNN